MILFGASGHCKVVLDILIQTDNIVEAILDDAPKVESIFDVPVMQNNLDANSTNKAIITIGNNKTRRSISEKYALDYIKAIHPKAIISRFSSIGNGTVVMANVVINSGVEIGEHCIINTASIVEHDCVIDDFAHISPNASLAGNVHVQEGAHIGIGATVIQGITIGKWAVIGAGAVIIKNVPDFATVVGNPGRII